MWLPVEEYEESQLLSALLNSSYLGNLNISDCLNDYVHVHEFPYRLKMVCKYLRIRDKGL